MRRAFLALAAIMIVALSLLFYLTVNRKAVEPGVVVGVDQVLGGPVENGFARAVTPRRFQFPRDHGPHEGFRNEWWYFTGNLRSDDGRRFGYQLTFFRVALSPRPAARSSRWGTNELFMAHFALTDVNGKKFHFAERFSRAALGLAGAGGDPLAVRLEDWSARETKAIPWSMKLTASDADMSIDLDLSALTPEILNGEGGLSRKSDTPGNASYYYSLPRMRTVGTVRAGKERFRVSGLSWLDREWSTSALEKNQVGWDWFALQLDDGRAVMFYRLRRRDGSIDPYSGGTLVAANGGVTPLTRDQVRLEVSRWWTSPATGVRYPALWRMRIASAKIDMEITPRLENQELSARFRYWEGAVAARRLSGSAGGSGYLEMTGY